MLLPFTDFFERQHTRLNPFVVVVVFRGAVVAPSSTMPATKGQPPRMTTDEVRLIRSIVHEQGQKPTEVALLVNRSLGAVCRQLMKSRPTQMGRPVALSAKQVAKLVDTVESLVTKADAEYEVTLCMVLRHSRLKASERTASRALHKMGYRFRKLRSKMI